MVMNLDAWKIDPLSQVLSDGVGMMFMPEPEAPAPKAKKPRAKKGASTATPSMDPESLLSVLQEAQPEVLIEEDTTPYMWDGNLPEPPYPWMQKNDWKLITSMDELWAWWAEVQMDTANHVPTALDIINNTGKRYPKIGFDTETTGLDNRLVLGQSKIHLVGICLSSYAPRSEPYDVCYAPNDLKTEVPMKKCVGLYIPVAHDRWESNLPLPEVLAFLQIVFANAIIVTHNGQYDKLVLDNACPLSSRTVEFHNFVETVFTREFPNFPQYPFWVDTQSLWFMIDSNCLRNGLKEGANRFLNQPMIEYDEICDSGVKKKGSKKNHLIKFNQVPPFKATHYAAADAINTLQLSDCFGYIANQIPFINQIDHLILNNSAWVEKQRVLINRDYLLDEERFLAFKCQHTLQQIHRIAGCEVNPDSPAALGEILFVQMGLPNKGKTLPSRVYPTGSWKTDKDTLAELAAENPEHAIFKLIIAYREYRNAYPHKLYNGTDPLDLTAKITLQTCRAPTGRFACIGGNFELDGGCGLNVQAQKALYSVRNIDVLALDTEKYLGVDGLNSTSMFDPILFEWLRNHVQPVNMVQYPNKVAIKNFIKNANPTISDDDLSSQVKEEIKRQLEYHKECGLSTLKEGLQVLQLQDNATVINNHVKLTPDSWACMLHECPHCLKDTSLPLYRYPIEYDYTETMNLRRAFLAPPGWTFFSIDYGAIELRMVTNLSGEKLWIDGFVGGKDLHASMAEAVFQEKFRQADATTKSDLRSSAKCVSKDTYVWKSSGLTKIEDLWPSDTPKAPDTTVTVDPFQVWVEDKLVDCNTLYFNGVQATVKARLAGGTLLEATLIHPVRVITSTGNYIWKTMQDLQLGDIVCCTRGGKDFASASMTPLTPLEGLSAPATMTADLALWLGFVVGDGSLTTRNRITFVSSNLDTDMHVAFENLSKSLFGLTPCKYLDNSVTRYEITSPSLISWLELNRLTFRVNGVKNCPEPILWSGPVAWKAFICGLFSIDGAVHPTGVAKITTIYPGLAQQVMQMLWALGSDPSISVDTNKDHNNPRHILAFSLNSRDILQGSPVSRKTLLLEKIQTTRKRSINKRRGSYSKLTPWLAPLVKGVSASVVQDKFAWYPEMFERGWKGGGQIHTPRLEDSSAVWFMKYILPCEVLALETGSSEVYDLFVPDGNTFLANGVISHNTITFGNLYGGTASTIQANLEIPVTFDEAKLLYNNWLSAIPFYKDWVSKQKVFVNHYKRVFTAFGRIRNLTREMSGDRALQAYGERTALNHPSQGSAADILRVALSRIQAWILQNGLQDVVKLHFHVHDELNLSCKDEWVPFIIPNILRMLRVDDLIQQLKWPVPLDCDVEYGESWSVVAKFWDYAKGKGARWSKIKSLSGLNQDTLKQLYDSIIQGADFTADMYRKTYIPAIYAHWDKIGYTDPYRDFVVKRQERFDNMQVWCDKNPGHWPTPEDLDSSN